MREAESPEPWTVARAVAELPPDSRWEIDQGRLEMREPAGFYHGSVALHVAVLLAQHVHGHGLGRVVAAETGFHLAVHPDTLRAPDAAFVSTERLRAMADPNAFADVPPDLAVEVLSPSDRPAGARRKAGQYLALGVRSVWLLDPLHGRLEQHLAGGAVRVRAGGDTVEDPTLPGFRCTVEELFPPLQPPT